MSPAELVKCITSVKTLLKSINLGSIKVGTADSWNLWVNGANVDVIRACDIVLSNAFSVIPPLVTYESNNSTGKARTSQQMQPIPLWMISCKP
jgi:exo-beta-1,3-glucanase (GH17 family)